MINWKQHKRIIHVPIKKWLREKLHEVFPNTKLDYANGFNIDHWNAFIFRKYREDTTGQELLNLNGGGGH